ncbi:MAG: class II fructose-bisphosphate aldolase [Deltaproteobacteria bacterium]|nr:class II fructose-bisphosphate aldolase [Deltaproteobacteria bacterium]
MAVFDSQKFERALQTGRPPSVKKLFPNSRALIVSGKAVDRAMLAKGRAVALAANARNRFVIYGTLRAAQRANAAVIIEIAKSEGTYCAVDYWNLATFVDAVANELGITVPVAVHADHYTLKTQKDVEVARREIPSMFDAGVTSVAIDASHMPEDQNLLASIELGRLVPGWAGRETEVGEIKGDAGLSTPEEALFLIRGLNAHGIFPDWIALNNGTTHGIEASESGIRVELTAEIHRALEPYRVSGAQHGTSGNSFERLRRIRQETRTTKANVATALQMISWGVKVNEYGNAIRDETGSFARSQGGAAEDVWASMVSHAAEKGWKLGDYKKLNLPFEAKLWSQPPEIRERMIRAVEDFAYLLITDVFGSADTAPLAIDAILEANSYDLGPKAQRVEDPGQWTPEKIVERCRAAGEKERVEGNFED